MVGGSPCAASELELCIDAYFASGLRRRWRDSQQHRLEEFLNKFAIGLLRGAVEQRAERLERERQHQEYLEQQRRAEEERQRQVAAKRRVEILDHCLASWHKSQEVRAFLEARFPPGSTAGAAEAQDPELQRWLDWANRYAAHLEKCAGSFPEYEMPQRGW